MRIEPDNCVDKYAVCVEKYKKVVGHLKKENLGSLQKSFSTS